MKKEILLLVVCLFLFACKKKPSDTGTASPQNPVTPKGYKVEYKILPAENYFTNITYNDSTGNSVSVSDLNEFSGGDKKFTVLSKPFDAKIDVTVYNTTTNNINYSLYIIVNDSIKKMTSFVAPAELANTQAEAEYEVQ